MRDDLLGFVLPKPARRVRFAKSASVPKFARVRSANLSADLAVGTRHASPYHARCAFSGSFCQIRRAGLAKSDRSRAIAPFRNIAFLLSRFPGFIARQLPGAYLLENINCKGGFKKTDRMLETRAIRQINDLIEGPSGIIVRELSIIFD
jgi:hypothetical protein